MLVALIALAALAGVAGPLGAQVVTADVMPSEAPGTAYLADVAADTPARVTELLERLESLAAESGGFPSHAPVVMVLHGDEAAAFTRMNYAEYKDTVDRAARLEAFGLLDVRICERWMRDRGLMRSDLPPFVDTVPDGLAEQRRLERAGYVSF